MPLEIKGLSELRERLERLQVEEVMARALAEQAARMAEAVRETLSEPPGAGGHDQPWLRSGALRDSVGAEADGLQAAVGSSDPAAAPQEMGTARTPPRPFLAPVAAGMGEDVARAVGARVAAALRGESGSDDASDAMPHAIQASATMPDAGAALLGLGAAALGYLILKDRVPKAPSLSLRPGPTVLEHSSGEDEDAEGVKRPPPGSKPIDQTPWSGDHQEIKRSIGAAAKDDTRISPDGDVWSHHPDGTWTNYGPAQDFTGPGRPKGQRGKDRR